MVEKKKVPEHIQKFYDLMGKVEGVIATTDHNHRKAYLAGEETIKDGGVIKHDLLKDVGRRRRFVDAMAGVYLDAAKDYFHIGDDVGGDEVWHEQLLNAYAGTTSSELLKLIDKHKETFTYERFEKYQDQFLNNLRESLGKIPSSHLEEEHIDDILKETQLEKAVDGSKISVDQAAALLGTYKREGAVPKSILKSVIPDYAVSDETYK